ncbi:hypothetical protein [Mycoplasma sp. 1012]
MENINIENEQILLNIDIKKEENKISFKFIIINALIAIACFSFGGFISSTINKTDLLIGFAIPAVFCILFIIMHLIKVLTYKSKDEKNIDKNFKPWCKVSNTRIFGEILVYEKNQKGKKIISKYKKNEFSFLLEDIKNITVDKNSSNKNFNIILKEGDFTLENVIDSNKVYMEIIKILSKLKK